jgi:AraC-like DNA-binding protein
MKIQNSDQKTNSNGCQFYTETSYSNILGSAIHSFHFKTQESLTFQVNYQESIHKMVLCLDGFSKNYQKHNHRYSFEAGKALLYKTNTDTYLSEIRKDTEYNLIHLHFSQTMMEEMKQLSANIFKENIMEIPMFFAQIQLFKDLERFQNTNASLASLLIEKTMLDQLFAFAKTRLSIDGYQTLKSQGDKDKIYEAKQILDASSEYISIEKLARQIGINTFKLKNLFKEEFKKPIFEYQVNVHFSRAQAMLLDTTNSIQDIALSCGYQSVGSFSNAFKRKFSVRPSDMRKY